MTQLAQICRVLLNTSPLTTAEICARCDDPLDRNIWALLSTLRREGIITSVAVGHTRSHTLIDRRRAELIVGGSDRALADAPVVSRIPGTLAQVPIMPPLAKMLGAREQRRKSRMTPERRAR